VCCRGSYSVLFLGTGFIITSPISFGEDFDITIQDYTLTLDNTTTTRTERDGSVISSHKCDLIHCDRCIVIRLYRSDSIHCKTWIVIRLNNAIRYISIFVLWFGLTGSDQRVPIICVETAEDLNVSTCTWTGPDEHCLGLFCIYNYSSQLKQILCGPYRYCLGLFHNKIRTSPMSHSMRDSRRPSTTSSYQWLVVVNTCKRNYLKKPCVGIKQGSLILRITITVNTTTSLLINKDFIPFVSQFLTLYLPMLTSCLLIPDGLNSLEHDCSVYSEPFSNMKRACFWEAKRYSFVYICSLTFPRKVQPSSS
jgi:hypothetical protein